MAPWVTWSNFLLILLLGSPSMTQNRGVTETAPRPAYQKAATPATAPEVTLPTPGSDLEEELVPPTGSRCQGYYDVMGQWDPPFNCNVGIYLYCCGTCFYRFCCQFRQHRLDQTSCSNYDTPLWANTGKPGAAVTEARDEHDRDRTHMIVYIICGVVAIMVLVGIFTKLGLEKSRGPQTDMTSSRALTELLKQPGGEVACMGRTVDSPLVGTNGIPARMLRSRSEQYHLNNVTLPHLTPGTHTHGNLNVTTADFSKYTPLKTINSTPRGHYKSYPMMDFTNYQAPPLTFQPIAVHPKEKPFLPPQTDITAPLNIAIPVTQLPRPRVAKTVTQPLPSSSALKAWDSSRAHVQRQSTHPGYASTRRQAYSVRRRSSIEMLPEMVTQPPGYRGHGDPHLHPKYRVYSTNSKTEVTV